jgi:glycosyltransferase involved in cell wall biosynthesis
MCVLLMSDLISVIKFNKYLHIVKTILKPGTELCGIFERTINNLPLNEEQILYSINPDSENEPAMKRRSFRICLSVTNDIATDQRVNRIACSLQHFSDHITIVGRKRRNSLKPANTGIRNRRFSLLFNKGPLFYACYNIRLFFYLLFHRFDLLVANDLDTLPANFLISKIKRTKLVYDSHEYFTEVPELINRDFVRKFWERLEKIMVPEIKYSYTVCDSIAEIYQQKYDINMITIRNLADCYLKFPASSEMKLSDEDKRNLLDDTKRKSSDVVNGKPSDRKIILYQGSVNKGRGLELVIESMQYLDDAVFRIIGDGDILHDLESLVAGLGLDSKVIFTGRIPPDELLQYTVQADIGISLEENLGLNYYYALPNKFFDYISANVPVVVSDFPEMGSLVKKYDIGIATSIRNARELALLFRSVLSDTESIRKWKHNLRRAASELCWEKEEKKLLEFYGHIILP